MKLCPKCKIIKPLSKFGKNRAKKDGLACYCRKCAAQWKRGEYARDPGKYRRRKREYRRTIKGHLKQVFNNMRRRCENPLDNMFKFYGARGIENRFQSLDSFRDYVIDYLEIDPRGLQIDRIDNDGHYEAGNIRFVTCKVNANNRRNSK